MKIVREGNIGFFTIEESDKDKIFCVAITDNDSLDESEKEFIKNNLFPRESTVLLSKETTIEGLFTQLGITKSKTDARNQNRRGPIEQGFTDIENIGKLKKNVIIWNIFK